MKRLFEVIGLLAGGLQTVAICLFFEAGVQYKLAKRWRMQRPPKRDPRVLKSIAREIAASDHCDPDAPTKTLGWGGNEPTWKHYVHEAETLYDNRFQSEPKAVRT